MRPGTVLRARRTCAGLAVAALVATATLVALPAPTPTGAGEAPALCSSVSGAHIPADLMVDACYDGANIVLVNRTHIVLRANTTPYVARASVVPADGTFTVASLITLGWEVATNPDPDPYLLPPGARLTIPTGDAGNQISIQIWDRGDVYAIADWAATWIPGIAEAGIAVDAVRSLVEVDRTFRACLDRSNFIGDVACTADAGAAAVEILKTVVVKIGVGEVSKLAGALLNFFETSVSVAGQVEDIARFTRTSHSITVDARATAPPPSPTAPPVTAPAPPGPTTPTPTAALPPSPTAPPVTAPPAASTWLETVGGDTHTWTNPTNAGGYEGPLIPNGTTVQIACKLPGFRVADGNTWWYRIAQSPWSGSFYASADAFYNNGATSGSLHGTPYVDAAVTDC